MSTIRFTSFPRTEPPPHFIERIVGVFQTHESEIATEIIDRHLKSDAVLALIADGLQALDFQVELGKAAQEKISRPVFFGENGKPTLRYEVDAFQPEWRCGLEVEGIRAV